MKKSLEPIFKHKKVSDSSLNIITFPSSTRNSNLTNSFRDGSNLSLDPKYDLKLSDNTSNTSSIMNYINIEKSINIKMVDERIKLNIGGTQFVAYMSTLKRIPNTVLSTLSQNDENYDPINNEYFFDRSPYLFDYIINFYRTGELHVPIYECGTLFKNELEFWKIEEKHILACCWHSYSRFRDTENTLKKFDNLFNLNDKKEELFYTNSKIGFFERYKRKFWIISEYPFLSYGHIFTAISVFFVAVSILNSILITYRPWYVDYAIDSNNTTQEVMISGYPSSYFKISDLLCAIFFTIEFLLRVICCPNIIKFSKSVFNWIELLALVGIYVEVVLEFIDIKLICFEHKYCPDFQVKIIKVLQLIRTFRLVKLFKSFTGMRVVIYTIRSSLRELSLIITLLISGVIIFGCLMFIVEGDPENKQGFKNLPISLWFAIVTMTTVGFGDIVPKCVGGYLVGFICAICGVLVVAFTVPVAVNNFKFFYSYAQSRIKHAQLVKIKKK